MELHSPAKDRMAELLVKIQKQTCPSDQRCNPYIRNLIREVLFIPRLMLRLLPILAVDHSPTLSDEISDIGVTELH